jgi:Uma2 family endonuclease
MEKITDISQLDFSKQYTYADYLTWQLKERVELIKGWLYKMSPAPSRKHQRILSIVFNQMFNFLEQKNCQVYTAPFDVRLVKNKGQKDKEIDTIVQPDICVVCDEAKLDARGCSGSPDLVVEILSPSTGKKDYNEKYFLYEKNGVREYWIINPDAESVEIFHLQKGEYNSIGVFGEYDLEGDVSSQIFPDLTLKLSELFK